MGHYVSWLPDESRDGVLERSFTVEVSGTVVPGVLWQPAEPGDRVPIVLLGHGGSARKRSVRNLELSRWFATEAQTASMAIDGPYHGDRATRPRGAGGYQELIRAEGLGVVVDRMVRDWRAALDAVGNVDALDTGALGYIGLSMGTRFGIPLAAALGDALRGAVFGKFGLVGAPGMYDGMDMKDRLTTDAGRVSAPTLLHVQWDDELFPREGQFALFDALGASDKELIAYPGGHGDLNPIAPLRWRSFIATRLAP
jgi:dienelactone hydrolase